jgi:putative addiction module component (TIGR02574 family)
MTNAILPEPPGFDSISKEEQIEYLQDLWDSISKSPDDIPVPDSHIELVKRRMAAYRKDPNSAGSAFDVINKLRKEKD